MACLQSDILLHVLYDTLLYKKKYIVESEIVEFNRAPIRKRDKMIISGRLDDATITYKEIQELRKDGFIVERYKYAPQA